MTYLEHPSGCWFDVMSPEYLALSADASVAQAVADWLQAGQDTGALTYETGRTR